MSCDHCNDFTNFGGTMGLGLTRPLMSFYADPRTVVIPHWDKPHDGTPPRVSMPPGPQVGPGFRPVSGGPAASYAPGYVDDGWVPGGLALRLGA
jgi:hypothetical protein